MAPFGSQNALGNKGGGRKSAYQENADAEDLYEMFFGDVDKQKLKDIVEGKKSSIKDILMAKAFEGSEKVLIEIFKKIFPDSLNIGGQPGNPLRTLTDEELDNRLKKLRDSLIEYRGRNNDTGGADKKDSTG